MTPKKLFLPVLMSLLLVSCAASDDPREGGLLGYWHGTSSGKYEERRQEKIRQLEEEKRKNQQLSEQAEQYSTEIAIHDKKLAEEQRRVVGLEQQLSSLNSKLDRLQTRSVQQREEVASLRAKIKTAKQSIETQKAAIADLDSRGGSAADPNQTRILEYERDRLADEYRKLNVYYQALSNAIY